MAAVELKIDTSKWEAMIKRLSSKENWRMILRKVASVISFKDVQQHFKDEQGSDGAWKEWSPAYQKYRERLSNRLATSSAKRRARAMGVKPVAFAKKLVLTGTLRQSFVTPFDMSSGDEVAVLENRLKYASAHDLGTSKMPQRQFMWLSNNALDLISQGFLHSLARSAQ